jgi:hypothetical protein
MDREMDHSINFPDDTSTYRKNIGKFKTPKQLPALDC